MFNTQEKIILKKLTKWCSRGEKCQEDIHHWFFKNKILTTDIEKYINYLKKNDFVNDTRYAAAFVHDKFLFNNWGKLKIAAKLKEKKIPEPTIKEAIKKEIDDTKYKHVLQMLIKKKKKSLDIKDILIAKQKIRNFALSKGFEPDLIFRDIENLIKN